MPTIFRFQIPIPRRPGCGWPPIIASSKVLVADVYLPCVTPADVAVGDVYPAIVASVEVAAAAKHFCWLSGHSDHWPRGILDSWPVGIHFE